MLQTVFSPRHRTCLDVFADTEMAATHSITPIPFPDPEAVNRARDRQARATAAADNLAFGERQRHAAAVSAASQNGRDEGHAIGWKAGYRVGVTWGVLCGSLSTVLVGALVIMGLSQLIGIGWLK